MFVRLLIEHNCWDRDGNGAVLTSSAVVSVVAGSSAVAPVAIRAKPHTHARVLAGVVATGIHCRQVCENRWSTQLLNNWDTVQLQQQFPHLPQDWCAHGQDYFKQAESLWCFCRRPPPHIFNTFFLSLRWLPVPPSCVQQLSKIMRRRSKLWMRGQIRNGRVHECKDAVWNSPDVLISCRVSLDHSSTGNRCRYGRQTQSESNKGKNI